MSYYNRVEEIPIDMELDKSAFDRHALALKIIMPNGVPVMENKDTLKVHWKMTCAYLEETALALEAIGSICDDPEVIVNANCAPLEEGKILVFNVLEKLKKVIKKIRKRKVKAMRRMQMSDTTISIQSLK